MRISVFLISIFILITATPVSAQKRKKKNKKADKEAAVMADYFNALPGKLKKHVYILASDSLEGRRTGTKGEQLAADYISKRFAENGITPAGDNSGWLQVFEVNEGRQFEDASTLWINDKKLVAGKDFFPYNTSASGKADALVSPVFKEEQMPWFLDLKEELEKNKSNPHYNINNYIAQKASVFEQKKATAVIIYNQNDDVKFDAKSHPVALKIPVICLSKDAAGMWLKKRIGTGRY